MVKAKKSTTKKAVKKKVAKKMATKKPVNKKAVKKVSSKKKAPKKTTKKKSVKRKTKKKTLVKAPEHKRFWTRDGHIVADLFELKETISAMSVELYEYHTKGGSNHFALWVELVLDEPALAKKMNTVRSKSGALRELTSELKKYS